MSTLADFQAAISKQIAQYSATLDRSSPVMRSNSKNYKLLDLANIPSASVTRLLAGNAIPVGDFNLSPSQFAKISKSSLCYCEVTLKLGDLFIPVITVPLSFEDDQITARGAKSLSPLLLRKIFDAQQNLVAVDVLIELIRTNSYTISAIRGITDSIFPDSEIINESYLASTLDERENAFIPIVRLNSLPPRENPFIYNAVIASQCGVEKARKQILGQVVSDDIHPVSTEHLYADQRLAVEKFLSGHSFSVKGKDDAIHEVFESIVHNANNSQIRTLIIAPKADVLSYERLTHPNFYTAKQNLISISSQMHQPVQGMDITPFGILSNLIRTSDLLDESVTADAPSIEESKQREIFEQRDMICQNIDKLYDLGVLSASSLNNLWLGAHIGSDDTAQNLQQKLILLINNLIPEMEGYIAQISEAFNKPKLESLASWSMVLGMLNKLIQIYDTFKIEVMSTDLQPYIEVTSDETASKFSFFEKRALLGEAKKLLRPGVFLATNDELHQRLLDLQDVTAFFNKKFGEDYKNLLPTNIHEIVENFDAVALNLSQIEVILADDQKIKFIDLPWDELKKVLARLQKAQKTMLQNIDEKIALLDSLQPINNVLEYFFKLISSVSKAQLKKWTFKTVFEFSLYKSMLKVVVRSNPIWEEITASKIDALIRDIQSPQKVEKSDRKYIAFASLPEIESVAPNLYDTIVLYYPPNHPAVSFWPILIGAKSVVALGRRNVLPGAIGDVNIAEPRDFIANFNPESEKSVFETSLIKYLAGNGIKVKPAKSYMLVEGKHLALVLDNIKFNESNIADQLVLLPKALKSLGIDTLYISLVEFFLEPANILKKIRDHS